MTSRNTVVQDRHGLSDGGARRLTDTECAASRAWARANYKRGADVNPNWHPIVKDECALMNEETGT